MILTDVYNAVQNPQPFIKTKDLGQQVRFFSNSENCRSFAASPAEKQYKYLDCLLRSQSPAALVILRSIFNYDKDQHPKYRSRLMHSDHNSSSLFCRFIDKMPPNDRCDAIISSPISTVIDHYYGIVIPWIKAMSESDRTKLLSAPGMFSLFLTGRCSEGYISRASQDFHPIVMQYFNEQEVACQRELLMDSAISFLKVFGKEGLSRILEVLSNDEYCEAVFKEELKSKNSFSLKSFGKDLFLACVGKLSAENLARLRVVDCYFYDTGGDNGNIYHSWDDVLAMLPANQQTPPAVQPATPGMP